MEYIYIGEIVNTHGLKGELKIRSDFKYKKNIFVPGFKLYINNRKEEVIIHSHRTFKDFDLVAFEDHLDINEVLGYKGEKAFINKDDVVLADNQYLADDLIGLKCYADEAYIGDVVEIINNKASDIFIIRNGEKEFMVPYVDQFVNKIDVPNKTLIINNMEGLLL